MLYHQLGLVRISGPTLTLTVEGNLLRFYERRSGYCDAKLTV